MHSSLPTPSQSKHRAGLLDSLKHFVTSARRTIVRLFTRDSIIAVIRTLAWVAPLTMLIWAIAERETQDQEALTVPFSIRLADPTRVLTLRSQPSVLLTARGPRGRFARFKDEVVQFRNGEPAVKLEVQASQVTNGPNQALNIVGLLKESPIFKDNAIEIEESNPRSINVDVDELKEMSVEVRRPKDLDMYVSDPAYDPQNVTIRGPDVLLSAAKVSGTLAVYPDLSDRVELKTPGEHRLSGVRLLCSESDKNISINPSTINVTVTVREADEPFVLSYVTITAAAPPQFWDKFRVEGVPPSITNVTIIGAPDKIDAIQKSPNWVPPEAAVLEITNEDAIKNAPIKRKLKFRFPDGIRATGDALTKEIEFRVVPR